MNEEKIKVVQMVPRSENVKALMRFIVQIKWHSRFLRYLSNICSPSTHLTKKDVAYVWGEAQEKSFQILKKMMMVTPILQAPD